MQGIKAPDPNLEQTFTEMVNTHQTALLRMCYLNLHDREMAEDAVQETFIKAYRALPFFRGACNPKTWLMRIAINTCRDMQRGSWLKHLSRTVSLDQLAEPSESFSEDALAVNIGIAGLPVKLREAVLLYYYQDMTIEEAAEALGISVSSVAERLKRAKEKLRESLKEVYFDE
jgi:RNA polymerase sigma-70 factor (ECF subfamily)